MDTTKKQQLVEQLQAIRHGGEDTLRINIAATSGEIIIENRRVVNNILDFLLKELQTEISKDIQHE